jgi:hypothetical protein
MAKIAISYRREDSLDITGRIFDRFAAHYGRESVFRDIDSMRPGIDFRRHIKATLDASDILIVVVGPKWLGRDQSGQARISNEADFVRFELETALSKGIPVIPLLVGQAEMPTAAQLPDSIKDLAFRHAVSVSSGKDFDHHVSVLISDVDRLLEAADEPSTTPTAAEAAKGSGGAASTAATAASSTIERQPQTPSAASDPPLARASPSKALRLVIGVLLAAQAALRLYWDIPVLTRGDYVFKNDPLLIPEVGIMIPALIVVALGAALGKAWARIAGLVVCAYAFANDVYYLAVFPPPGESGLIATNAVFFATTILAALLLLFGWRRMAHPAK